MRPCPRAFTLLAIPYRSRLGRHGMRSRSDLAMLPKVLGADELSFSASRVFWGYVGVLLCGTCGAPRVIAPWRGESEWFPVSNPASCWDVDVREDGRSRRLFRGPRRQYSLPLGSPIWGFTAHVGGRPLPPEFIYMGLAVLSYFGCFSALRLHVSAFRGSFAARFGCERVGVLIMNWPFCTSQCRIATSPLTHGRWTARVHCCSIAAAPV